jgi:CubicO group peptidase (beta-lactamase class C family)
LEPIESGFGMFWLVDGDRRWHNGQTGGYSSYLVVDLARGQGVAVLADAADAATLERLALGFLGSPSP